MRINANRLPSLGKKRTMRVIDYRDYINNEFEEVDTWS